MSNFRMTFLLAASLLAANLVLAQWNVDNADVLPFANGTVGKNIAVDDVGNVHAIFRSGNSVMYYMRSVETDEWSGSEMVTDSASMGNIGELAIDWDWQTAQPVVAFASNSHVWFATRDEGNAWVRQMVGNETEAKNSPDIAVNLAGVIYIVSVMEFGDTYELEYCYYDGITWDFDTIDAELGQFGSGASPRVAVESNGAGHVVFRAASQNGYIVQHGTNEQLGGIGWALTTLVVPHAESYPGDIAVEPDRTVHCVSQGSEGFGIPRPVYYHRRNPAGMWTMGIMASASENAGDPLVAFDTDGAPHTMWQELDGNFYTGFMFYSTLREGWAPHEVFDNMGGGAAFVVDVNNYGHLLFADANGGVQYLKSSAPLDGSEGEPELTLVPASIDFDSVEVGQDSIVQVRLENSGDGMLTLSAFDVASNGFNGPPQWLVVNLAPGAFMTTEVRFAPDAEQNYLGYALVWSNAPSSPDTLYLSGHGYIASDAPDAPLPLAFELKPLYPNPFNGAVNISYSLPHASEMTLRVYDVLGREVGVIANGVKQAGQHNSQWNCAECAAGIYLFKLEAAGQSFVQKAAYVK